MPRAERLESVRRGFSSLLGKDAVSSRSADPEGGIVLRPGAEEEVASALELASRQGWRLVPMGAGTWLSAGDPLEEVDAFLSVSRLNAIVRYEPADLTLTVGAGITLRELSTVVGAEGQWLPLDPPGSAEGSLGATLATSSAGALSTLYGAPRDLSLGLRLATGDGRVLSFGGQVVKNVAGFDMVKLAVGSWGTLGAITEATLRLYPLPESETLLLARAARLEDLLEAARQAVTSPMLPAAVELAEHSQPGAEGKAVLRVRVHGLEARVRKEVAVLEERMSPTVFERLSLSAGGRDLPWGSELAGAEDEGVMVLRLRLPPSELGALVHAARELVPRDGFQDGPDGAPPGLWLDASRAALTLTVRDPVQDTSLEADWESRLRETRRELERRRGSLTVLRGPAGLVRAVGSWGEVGAAGRVMAELKAQFDPAGILAPGRLVFP